MTDSNDAAKFDSRWDGFVLGAAVGATTTLLLFVLVLVVGWDQLTDASADDSVAASPTTLAPTVPPSGAEVAQVVGCIACHSLDGSELVGPSWLGTAGSERPIEGGGSVLADRDYLRQSIIDPSAIIVAGFPDVMVKTFGDTLSDAEIDALIDYIESLG
jgi:cytochrome c oxidase subunit 2